MNKIYSGSSTTIVFWTRKLSLSILLFGCLCSPTWGQSKATESQVEIVGSPSVDINSAQDSAQDSAQVKIRIKVKKAKNQPETRRLEYKNFKLLVDGKQVNIFDFKNPQQAEPVPTWIIFLLDLSGSMNKEDSQGTKKLHGAIDAIKKFTQTLARGQTLATPREKTQVAIVPFGKSGKSCSKGYPVTETELNRFFPASDVDTVSDELAKLIKQDPCAATNIYESLTNAINFLGNSKDKPFYVAEDSEQPQPRLAVVLLSDGYDSVSSELNEEEKRFQNLISLLKKQNEQNEIVVHTLGYGLTPEKLREKHNFNKPVTRENIRNHPKLQEEFVDKDRLAEIANVTGGIAELSPDAKTVAKKLELFVDALLGEYEITYTQPNNAERGSKHYVHVEVLSKFLSVKSKPKSYRIPVFGGALPFPVRLLMLVIVFILLIVGGVIPFWLWGRALKREALET